MTIDSTLLTKLEALQLTTAETDTRDPETPQTSQLRNLHRLQELGIVDQLAYLYPGFSFDYAPTDELYVNLHELLHEEHAPGISLLAIIDVLRKTLHTRSHAPILYGEEMQGIVGWEYLSKRFLELVHQRAPHALLEEVLSPECLEEAKAACQKKPRKLTLLFLLQERVQIQSLYNLLKAKKLLTEATSFLESNKEGFCYVHEEQYVHFRFQLPHETHSTIHTSGEAFHIWLTDAFLEKKGPICFPELGFANQWCVDAMLKLSHFYVDDSSSAGHLLFNLKNGYDPVVVPMRLAAFEAWQNIWQLFDAREMLLFFQFADIQKFPVTIKLEVNPTTSFWHACLDLLNHISYPELEAVLQVFGAIRCRLPSDSGLTVTCTDVLGAPHLVFQDDTCTLKVPLNLAQAVDAVSKIENLDFAHHLYSALTQQIRQEVKSTPMLVTHLPKLPDTLPYLVEVTLSGLYPHLFSKILEPFIAQEPSELLFQAMQVAFIAQGLVLHIDPINPVVSYIEELLLAPNGACKRAGQNLLVSLEGHAALKAKWLPQLPEVSVKLYEQLANDLEATEEQKNCWQKSPRALQIHSLLKKSRQAAVSSAEAVASHQEGSPLSPELRKKILKAFAYHKAFSVELNVKVVKALLRIANAHPSDRNELLLKAIAMANAIYEQESFKPKLAAAKSLVQACRPDDSVRIQEAIWPSLKLAKSDNHLSQEFAQIIEELIVAFLPRVGLTVLLDMFDTMYSKAHSSVEFMNTFTAVAPRLLTLSCESKEPKITTRTLALLHTIYTQYSRQYQDFVEHIPDFVELASRLYLTHIMLNGWEESTRGFFDFFKRCCFPDIGQVSAASGFVTTANTPLHYNHYVRKASSNLLSICPRYQGQSEWPYTSRMNSLIRTSIELAIAPGISTSQKVLLLDFALQNMRNMIAHHPATSIERETFLQLEHAIQSDDPLYPAHVALVTLLRHKAKQKGIPIEPPDFDEQASITIPAPLSDLGEVNEETAPSLLVKQQIALSVWQETHFVDEYERRFYLVNECLNHWKRYPEVVLVPDVVRSMNTLLIPNSALFGNEPLRCNRSYPDALREIYQHVLIKAEAEGCTKSSDIAIRCLQQLCSFMDIARQQRGYAGEGCELYVEQLSAILKLFIGKRYLPIPTLKDGIHTLIDAVLADIPARHELVELFFQVIRSNMPKEEKDSKFVHLCFSMATKTVRVFEQDNPLSSEEALAKIRTLIELYKSCDCGLSPHLRNKVFEIITSTLQYVARDSKLADFIHKVIGLFVDPKVVSSLKGMPALQGAIFKLAEQDPQACLTLINTYLPRLKTYKACEGYAELCKSLNGSLTKYGFTSNKKGT